ncbi:glycosyltransferase [Leptolyngbya sp. 'hensonii']|uniref:glycosyltransferase n=1 Tax=Leptolyngbya sp. 'hensonii' TaxID=1922337 RepID=UPI00094FA053|nr:glycosyltransferase [Leptolyngbya sp. 'hensonii']OLP18780.1 glycosyltransferase [Leptolyngbya sp. 'hensonii']
MKPDQTPSRFHLWFPDIFEFKGGIQVYSAFLLQALQQISPAWDYDVFLKHDTRATLQIPVLPGTRFHFAGRWPLPFRTLVYGLQLWGWGLLGRPHLVITTHLNFSVVAYWLNRMIGTPYWAVAHGVEAWNIRRPGLRVALRHADRILAVSNYTRDRLLQEQHLDPDRVLLLPNTFDADRFQPGPRPPTLLQRYGLTATQPIILTVARLDASERYKGYDQILQALPRIRAQIPTVRYILAGKGNDRPRIEQMITALDLQDCVTLTGFVPDQELADHYNLCDVFAMPSQGEGFGIVYLEALACGKPTIGGNQDGAIDALAGGELGVLVDPNDVATLAQILIQVLEKTYPHPLMYQPVALRQRVIELFGFEHFQQTLAKLLQTIL